MNFLKKIADQRILEAMARGDFDDLEGQGKPLELEEDALVPAEHRLANRVLKNAGYVPEEVRLRADISRMEQAVQAARDEGERRAALSRLGTLRLRLELGQGTPRTGKRRGTMRMRMPAEGRSG